MTSVILAMWYMEWLHQKYKNWRKKQRSKMISCCSWNWFAWRKFWVIIGRGIKCHFGYWSQLKRIKIVCSRKCFESKMMSKGFIVIFKRIKIWIDQTLMPLSLKINPRMTFQTNSGRETWETWYRTVKANNRQDKIIRERQNPSTKKERRKEDQKR